MQGIHNKSTTMKSEFYSENKCAAAAFSIHNSENSLQLL